jgi:hypothetical protein
MQMALQIAWKRMHNVPTAVYETASTRAFSHGRTETVRSLTSETWKMAKAFDDANVLVIFKHFLIAVLGKKRHVQSGFGFPDSIHEGGIPGSRC